MMIPAQTKTENNDLTAVTRTVIVLSAKGVKALDRPRRGKDGLFSLVMGLGERRKEINSSASIGVSECRGRSLGKKAKRSTNARSYARIEFIANGGRSRTVRCPFSNKTKDSGWRAWLASKANRFTIGAY